MCASFYEGSRSTADTGRGKATLSNIGLKKYFTFAVKREAGILSHFALTLSNIVTRFENSYIESRISLNTFHHFSSN